jgi:hypothetical protein
MKKHIAHDEGYKYIPLDDYENYFYNEDIEVASALLCRGYKLIDIVPHTRTKMTFVFKSHQTITDAVDGFWSNRIDVRPLEFANHRKNLKTRIFSLQKCY